MSLLKLHHISFRIVAVAYAMPLEDPFALRRTRPLSRPALPNRSSYHMATAN